MACIFCEPDDDLGNRVYYKDARWYAFLSSPPHTRGHTIYRLYLSPRTPQTAIAAPK